MYVYGSFTKYNNTLLLHITRRAHCFEVSDTINRFSNRHTPIPTMLGVLWVGETQFSLQYVRIGTARSKTKCTYFLAIICNREKGIMWVIRQLSVSNTAPFSLRVNGLLYTARWIRWKHLLCYNISIPLGGSCETRRKVFGLTPFYLNPASTIKDPQLYRGLLIQCEYNDAALCAHLICSIYKIWFLMSYDILLSEKRKVIRSVTVMKPFAYHQKYTIIIRMNWRLCILSLFWVGNCGLRCLKFFRFVCVFKLVVALLLCINRSMTSVWYVEDNCIEWNSAISAGRETSPMLESATWKLHSSLKYCAFIGYVLLNMFFYDRYADLYASYRQRQNY